MKTTQTFSSPQKRGADQKTTFVEVKHPDGKFPERNRPARTESTKTRGEDRFKEYDTPA